MRERALIQRVADNGQAGELDRWSETGELGGRNERPAEDTPEVHIAKEQIRKDGKVIPENVERAIVEWREQHKTSKPVGPS